MRAILITINPGLALLGNLPGGETGAAYTATLQAVGGLPPYSLALVVGTLPDGLTFTDNGDGTATIAGTPTETFAGLLVVRLTDADGVRVDRQLTLVIVAAVQPVEFLLTEAGDFLLLETGDKIELE